MNPFEKYEDTIRAETATENTPQYSPYCDFVYYRSSYDGVLLAMRVLKPKKPAGIVASTHGWHQSAPAFEPMTAPAPNTEHLTIEVDMRGRAFSQGQPDLNVWELYDVLDGIRYAQEHYQEYIDNPEEIHFEAGSGGGGNAYAIAAKFPDLFCSVVALCGISNYALWYQGDTVGEFRDEMDVWVGVTPEEYPNAYKGRSGGDLIGNLHSPLLLIHGEEDIRVPVTQAHYYLKQAEKHGKSPLVTAHLLKGIGGQGHYDGATPQEYADMIHWAKQHRKKHNAPISLASKGTLLVGGYLFTKHFSVVLDSPHKLAVLEYDLEDNRFTLRCDEPCEYTLTLLD